jgi:uncharacterized protein YciI
MTMPSESSDSRRHRRFAHIARLFPGKAARASNACDMAESDDEPPIRLVAFHRPGPAWQPGTEFADQPGVREHVAHYSAALDDGHLEWGGPFIDSSGGMMVFARSVSRTLADEIAQADPAVRSGLLVVEVRPWLATLSR